MIDLAAKAYMIFQILPRRCVPLFRKEGAALANFYEICISDHLDEYDGVVCSTVYWFAQFG
jgi:hypothetical protein